MGRMYSVSFSLKGINHEIEAFIMLIFYLYSEDVKGIDGTNGDIVQELSLYSTKYLPKILRLFITDCNPSLLKAVEELE